MDRSKHFQNNVRDPVDAEKVGAEVHTERARTTGEPNRLVYLIWVGVGRTGSNNQELGWRRDGVVGARGGVKAGFGEERCRM